MSAMNYCRSRLCSVRRVNTPSVLQERMRFLLAFTGQIREVEKSTGRKGLTQRLLQEALGRKDATVQRVFVEDEKKQMRYNHVHLPEKQT